MVAAQGADSPSTSASAPAIAPKPKIFLEQIPFGAKRRAETAAYARRPLRHSHLVAPGPRVIVQHYTASNSLSSAYVTFAAAFGIEHVGTSGRQILANRAQLSASLALTVWLMSRYRIELRNVIGHNESLTEPVPPRELPRVALQDARRLAPRRDADLPRGARARA